MASPTNSRAQRERGPLEDSVHMAAQNQINMKTTLTYKVKNYNLLGIALVSLSTVFYSLAWFLVKYLKDVSPMARLVESSTIFMALSLSQVIASGESLKGVPRERRMVFYRALFGLMSLALQYFCLSLLPLVDSTTIKFCYPAFVIVFEIIFLKEKYGWFHYAVILFMVIGVVFVAKPSFIFGFDGQRNEYHLLGIILSIFGCLVTGAVPVALRKMRLTTASVVNFYFASLSVAGGSIILFAVGDFRWPNCGLDGMLICLNGLFFGLAQFIYTVAAKLERAAVLSIVRSLELVLSFILQLSFLGVTPTWNTVLGSCIILACVLLLSIQKKRS